MPYVFDSSSIYALVKSGRPELLARNPTSSLARYELGNILLTEKNLRRTIGEAEQKILLGLISRMLNVMVIVNVKGSEQKVVDIATRYNMSFYDATYVQLAKDHNAALITQDDKLSKKVKGYITTRKAEELL